MRTTRKGVFFSLVLISVLLFAVGCNSKTVGETGTTDAASAKNGASIGQGDPNKKTEIMLGTATTGGFTYIWGSAAATILNKYIPTVNFTAQITTGGSENIMRIINGEMPIGIAGSNVVQRFYDGDPSAKIDAHKNIRTLWASKSTIFSVIVREDSPYKTLEDLKGKKVSIGNKGGSAYESILTFLEALGMSGDYFDLQFLTMTESCNAMKTKTIEAFFTNTSDPHTAMTEVFMMPGGARFLDIPKDKLDTLLKKVPYLKPATRPAGTYKGQTREVVSVGSPYVLLAMENFPENIAYEIAKVLDERYEEWVGVAKNVEGSTLKSTIASSYAPLHPGVLKYAREKGLIQ